MIPTGQADARLQNLLDSPDLRATDTPTFLQGWHALFWLFPGLHPDSHDERDAEFRQYQPLARDGFRRADAREIDPDAGLYPSGAQHAGHKASHHHSRWQGRQAPRRSAALGLGRTPAPAS